MQSFGWKSLRSASISLVLALHLFLSVRAECRQIAQAHPKSSAPREVFLGVRLNGVDRDAERFLEGADQKIWAMDRTFDQWRIRRPPSAPLLHQGTLYFPLDETSGITYRVIPSEQLLEIQARPEAFYETRVGGTLGVLSKPIPPSLGSFLNYDFLGKFTPADNSTTKRLDGTFEVGIFSHLGVGTATALGQDMASGSNGKLIRLETTWTHDNPNVLNSYRLGDSISRGGSWGRPVRFGGAQWTTNFATQPGYVIFPTPPLRGEAVLPSTVDIYVNNILNSRKEVPPGPFEISNIPLVAGKGEVQLLVRDYLGREQMILQPYYVSSRLLRKGIRDFSMEAGALRENYAIESGLYGPGFFSATYRWGATDAFTPEGHTEILKDRQNLGLTSVFLLSKVGTLTGSVAGSRNSDSQTGGLLSLAFDRQVSSFGVGFQTTHASPRFAQMGQTGTLALFQRNSLVHFGFSPRGSDSLSLSYIDQKPWLGTRTQVGSASYSLSFLAQTLASLYVTRTLSSGNSKSDYLIGFHLTRSLGTRTSGSFNTQRQAGTHLTSVQIQQNLQDDPGVGYRVLAEHGPSDRGEASLFVQTNFGNYAAEFSGISGAASSTTYRLGASGGLAALGGSAFLSRRLDQSFGVVRVDGYRDVTVYAENRPIGKTRKNGSFLIPRLRPYDINRLSIEQRDLPIDAQVDSLELEVVPYFRSGVLATFPVRRSNDALLRILDSKGQEVPSGAILKIPGRIEEFPVGLHGEAFVKGLDRHNHARVFWDDQECDFEFELPEQPLAELGPFTCLPVQKEIKP